MGSISRESGLRGTFEFQRFSQGAQDVIVQAQAEANAAGIGYVQSLHLLLALVEIQSNARTVLEELGIDTGSIRPVMTEFFPPGQHAQRDPRTTIVRDVILDATSEAEARHSSTVEPAHMLMALVRQPDALAVNLVERLGITSAQVLAKLEPFMGDEDTGR